MGKDHQLNEQSRAEMRAKRKKTNKILNSMIVLVLLLIIVVSVKIFSTDNEKASENKVESVNSTVNTEEKSEPTSKSKKESSKEEKVDKGTKKESKEDSSENIEEEQIITDGGNDKNVLKTIVNPAWEPIGTSQTSGPAQNFDTTGVDWAEMVQAITYATGYNKDNGDILKRLENNGPKKSIGTIIKKDTQQILRVYLDWVDNEGWKPVLVEELTEIPSYINQ